MSSPPWSALAAAADVRLRREARRVRTRDRLESCPVARKAPAALGAEAWRIADELGFAKTYDAEYLALAGVLGWKLVTLDGRLRRGADRTGLVITPGEM